MGDSMDMRLKNIVIIFALVAPVIGCTREEPAQLSFKDAQRVAEHYERMSKLMKENPEWIQSEKERLEYLTDPDVIEECKRLGGCQGEISPYILGNLKAKSSIKDNQDMLKKVIVTDDNGELILKDIDTPSLEATKVDYSNIETDCFSSVCVEGKEAYKAGSGE